MTDLQTNITQLEALYEARHKTDHVFINWWVGTFVLGVLTGGLYLIYRFMKQVYRKKKHYERIAKFYEMTLYILKELTTTPDKNFISEDSLKLSAIRTQYRAITMKNSDWNMSLTVIIVHCLAFATTVFMGIIIHNAYPHPHDTNTFTITNLLVNLLGCIYAFPFWIFLYPFEIFALFFLFRSLMKDFVLFDNMEEGLLKGITPIVKTLLKNEQWELSFTKQCQPRNFWLQLALTLPTLGLNWIYVDYRLTVEAQKRFAESARVQGAILQALKQLAEQSTESTEAIENA